MTIKEILQKARRYMAKHGFCKHNLKDGKGQVCTRGAINAAMTGDPSKWPPLAQHDRVEGRFCKANGIGDVDNIPHWNNEIKRTKAQVLKAFDKAIKVK